MKANQSTTNTIVQVDAALHAQVDPSTTYAKRAASTELLAKAYQSTTYTLAEVDTSWSAKAKQAFADVNTEVDTELVKTAHVSDMTAAWNTSTRRTSTQADYIYLR